MKVYKIPQFVARIFKSQEKISEKTVEGGRVIVALHRTKQKIAYSTAPPGRLTVAELSEARGLCPRPNQWMVRCLTVRLVGDGAGDDDMRIRVGGTEFPKLGNLSRTALDGKECDGSLVGVGRATTGKSTSTARCERCECTDVASTTIKRGGRQNTKKVLQQLRFLLHAAGGGYEASGVGAGLIIGVVEENVHSALNQGHTEHHFRLTLATCGDL